MPQKFTTQPTTKAPPQGWPQAADKHVFQKPWQAAAAKVSVQVPALQLGRPIKKDNTIVNRFPFPKGVLPAAISFFQGPPVPRATCSKGPFAKSKGQMGAV